GRRNVFYKRPRDRVGRRCCLLERGPSWHLASNGVPSRAAPGCCRRLSTGSSARSRAKSQVVVTTTGETLLEACRVISTEGYDFRGKPHSMMEGQLNQCWSVSPRNWGDHLEEFATADSSYAGPSLRRAGGLANNTGHDCPLPHITGMNFPCDQLP